MAQLLDPLLIVAVALNFVALGGSRIRGVINAVALQGMLLGSFPLLIHHDIGLRGCRAGRRDDCCERIRHSRFPGSRHAGSGHPARGRPIVNYMTSLLLGAVGTGLAMVFSNTLPLAEGASRICCLFRHRCRRCGPAFSC